MAITLDQAAEMAMELPEVTEAIGGHGGRRQRKVADGEAFAWERPFTKADIKRFGNGTPPDGEILAAGTKGFLTTSHFDGYPAILSQLKVVGRTALRDALVDA